MSRAKNICRGKKTNGDQCNNWALNGSYYCHLHPLQKTVKDRKEMEKGNVIANIVLIIILFVFLMSLAIGCEDKFLKWISH
ncbi:MAG: hypothetical protein KKD86_17585 [Bacteroidetes bacterium]|nr:hypothetical protein [Bacteroidota bacterium]MBU1680639.1 hypothetical protein [Bacteroidota bacterium]